MTIDLNRNILVILLVILSSICILGIRKKIYKMLGICFSFYIVCLAKIVFFPIYIPSKEQVLRFKNAMPEDFCMVQYVPLKTIGVTLQSSNWLLQIGGNIVLLVPLVVFAGVFLDYKKKYSVAKTVVIGVGVSILIETIQGIMNYMIQYPNRIADIDDILLNSFGVLIVAVVYWLVRKIYMMQKCTEMK